jgi:cytochrome c peroxidase
MQRRSTWPWIASLALAAGLGAAEIATPPLGLDAYLPTPPGNPLTPERVALGRELFFEKRLSRDGTISCGVCHDPELGYTDKEPVAVGVEGKKGTRRTPRLINRAYGKSFFWDGRAATLEEQALKPIANPIEMDLAVEDAVALLRSDAGYAGKFEAAFEGGPTSERLAFALAAYVRTILSGDSPYDRYLAGDEAALTPAQQRGLALFRGKAACAVCHMGPNLTDERFHNTGVGWKDGKHADEGRAGVTGEEADLGAFKTPPLREVARGGPYMHDGSFETLEDVIDFYDEGGKANPNLDLDMQRLELTDAEKADLAAFLEALNGTVQEGR